MTAQTVLFICIAGVIAFAVAVYMYGYKTTYPRRLQWFFGTLRFITLFALFLLLINPTFKSETFFIEKPKLSILVDASSSIASLGQNETVSAWVERLQTDSQLLNKFDVRFFSFGSTISSMDSISFSEKQTHIDKALTTSEELFKNEITPTVLITDGNQTLGSDYEFTSRSLTHPIYPVIVGDTTQYVDVMIQQLNTNRYSFLKNEFPVETILVYNGKEAVSSRFVIRQAGSIVHSEIVAFTEIDNSKTLTVTLPSTQVGMQRYTATMEPLLGEKNTTNNTKVFAVEVIDQATKVLVVSSLVHPDLGTLKKAIESNEQRKVTFIKPENAAAVVNEYQLIVLFQPNSNFAKVFSEIETSKKNTLILTGLHTDWNFLNTVQGIFQKEATNAQEDVTAVLNLNYGSYAVEDFGFSGFPPLQTDFGALQIKVPHEVLLQQQVNGFSTENAMFASAEINGKRDALWDGEGIWKWRAQTYLKTENFQDFDDFIGKMIQYLASNKSRTRLEVNNETFYYSNNPILISAQYFDKSFVFDSRAQLEIRVTNTATKKEDVFPLLLKNNYFEVDLNTLPQGDYSFTVSVKNEAVSRSGNFTIIDFNVEQQFLNANVTKLRNLATNTGGKSFFTNEYQNLVETLLTNDAYKAIEKSQQKVIPLIDWKYLLALIVLALASEWISRKYNGLI
ncbi:MAG: VWA domain-containing protein [Flavobacteriaceae bacterium]